MQCLLFVNEFMFFLWVSCTHLVKYIIMHYHLIRTHTTFSLGVFKILLKPIKASMQSPVEKGLGPAGAPCTGNLSSQPSCGWGHMNHFLVNIVKEDKDWINKQKGFWSADGVSCMSGCNKPTCQSSTYSDSLHFLNTLLGGRMLMQRGEKSVLTL